MKWLEGRADALVTLGCVAVAIFAVVSMVSPVWGIVGMTVSGMIIVAGVMVIAKSKLAASEQESVKQTVKSIGNWE